MGLADDHVRDVTTTVDDDSDLPVDLFRDVANVPSELDRRQHVVFDLATKCGLQSLGLLGLEALGRTVDWAHA